MWTALLGRQYIFVWPLAHIFLFDLPFWIQITAQHRTRKLTVCGGEGRDGKLAVRALDLEFLYSNL